MAYSQTVLAASAMWLWARFVMLCLYLWCSVFTRRRNKFRSQICSLKNASLSLLLCVLCVLFFAWNCHFMVNKRSFIRQSWSQSWYWTTARDCDCDCDCAALQGRDEAVLIWGLITMIQWWKLCHDSHRMAVNFTVDLGQVISRESLRLSWLNLPRGYEQDLRCCFYCMIPSSLYCM